MKRSGWIKRNTPLNSRSKLRLKGSSDVSVLKDEIQDLVREIVIRRDGGCILRDYTGVPPCGGYRNDGELVLQADHLITRANSATYDDTRLIVCVCKGHHGWKKYNEKLYNAAVRELLSPARVTLWDRAEEERHRPTHRISSDWRVSVAALKQELASYESVRKDAETGA